MSRVTPRRGRALLRCCLLMTVVSCASCSSVKLADGIEPTRVRSIEKGQPRQRVEEVLGEPIEVSRTATGTLESYQCNLGLAKESLATGRTEAADEPQDALGSERFLSARNALFSFMFLGAPEIYAREEIERQRGVARVTYDGEGLVQDERIRCVKSVPESEPFVRVY